MSASGGQTEFIERWMASDQPEAPVLLSGERSEQLQKFATSLGQRDGTEVLVLSVDSSTIAVKEVRRLSQSLAKASLRDRRLVVIPEAARLSLPAAAALLKQLEEPSITTRYLLTTVSPRRLLPTILSRCQQVRLSTLTPDVNGETRGVSAAPADDEIEQVADQLARQFRRDGPTKELRLAFRRLRDYYQIKSLRGNEKLAREVLLASLPLRDT